VLEDLRGRDPKALAQALRGLLVAAKQDPQLAPVFSNLFGWSPDLCGSGGGRDLAEQAVGLVFRTGGEVHRVTVGIPEGAEHQRPQAID
jgi:hypothetical protein